MSMAEDLESAVLEVVDDARIAAVDEVKAMPPKMGDGGKACARASIPSPFMMASTRVCGPMRGLRWTRYKCAQCMQSVDLAKVLFRRASAAAAGSEYDLIARTQSMTPISSDFV
jgi:hypothetical protein